MNIHAAFGEGGRGADMVSTKVQTDVQLTSSSLLKLQAMPMPLTRAHSDQPTTTMQPSAYLRPPNSYPEFAPP